MKHFTLFKLVALTALFSTQASASELLPKRYHLTTVSAETIAKAALAHCQRTKTNISVSVVNHEGRLMYFYRGPNTGSNTIHTSFRKAYTSATMKLPTSQMKLFPEGEGYSQLGKMEDDILLLTGGLPIRYKGDLVGAIGLSGSPNPDVEEECGKQALKLFLEKH